VYWHTGLTARQPFVEHIDLDTDADVDLDRLLARIRASVEAHGADGYTEPAYVARTTDRNAEPADGAE
jgi:hypothetical protein